MTVEEFDAHGWRRGDKVVYEGALWPVFGIVIPLREIWIRKMPFAFEVPITIKCEDIKLVKTSTNQLDEWRGDEFYPEDDKRCRDGKPCSRKGKDCSWCELNGE